MDKQGRNWRVKVYRLDDSNRWVDEGTGAVACKFLSSRNAHAIQVISDSGGNSGKVLLETPIGQEDIYRVQGRMIITWCQPETGVELALSFEDVQGCETIWEQLCSIQGRVSTGFSSGDGVKSGSESDTQGTRIEQEPLQELLAPSVENLPKILDQLLSASTLNMRQTLWMSMTMETAGTNFLEEMVELFHSLDKSQNITALYTLHGIIRALIMFNDHGVIETLLSDKYFNGVVGILEYDPYLISKPDHRTYLASKLEHKMVVPIEDPEIMRKIHQSFRIRFLKDVLLPRTLDEASLSIICEMETQNGIEIAAGLHADENYLKNIFALLSPLNEDRAKRAEAVACLQELFFLAKKMHVPSRNAFYRSLSTKGDDKFYAMFEYILADPLSSVGERLNIGDILKLALQHEAANVRTFIMHEKTHPAPVQSDAPEGPARILDQAVFAVPEKGNTRSLMSQLMTRLVFDTEAGMQAQACEILKMMLDPETMEATEKEEFLTLFYDSYISWLVVPLEAIGSATSKKRKRDDTKTEYQLVLNSTTHVPDETCSVAQHHITELLSFCVQTHGYRIKYFVVKKSVVSKVLRLLSSRDKHLVLDAIRLARTCVGLKDDFYNRHIVQFDLFESIFEVFCNNGVRNNLINSATIELLEFIQLDNIYILLNYVYERYGEILSKITYVDTYQKIKEKYQTHKREMENGKAHSVNPFAERGNQPSSKEESYFEREEEATAPPNGAELGEEPFIKMRRKMPLVDYDDDEKVPYNVNVVNQPSVVDGEASYI